MVRWRGYMGSAAVAGVMLLCGCRQWFIDDADREVASLVKQRQMAALGFATETSLGAENGDIGSRGSMYKFAPSPTDSVVPENFRRATADSPPDETAPVTNEQSTTSASQATEQTEAAAAEAESLTQQPAAQRPFTLSDALAYAMRNARQFQTQKESLYIAALDLTLERHLWTPRFVDSVLNLDYANAGKLGDFDQSMTAVSNFAVQQRLPYGGEVTARVINTLIHNLADDLTTGESGQLILDARLPLLRGAGPVAYESRYQAERDLIYAVRRFERFRQEFLVDIAGDYFNLLSLKAQIESATAQSNSLKATYEREQALADAERILQIEADRARVSLLNADNEAVVARERYETSLDFFKIRLGMLTREPIDVMDESLTLIDPHVSITEAIETAVKYRLDLLNVRDSVDDARRQVEISRNSLLPQVDLRGGVAFNTDPARFNSSHFNNKLNELSAGVTVEVPLERKKERNDYRSSLIALRQSERDYDQAADNVRLQVRRALRQLEQSHSTIQIQEEQIRINEFRAAQAEAKLKAGQLPSNRDVVDAQNDLRDARNALAAAQANFRRAVLEFLRDSGTLRIGQDGQWLKYNAATGEPVAATPSEPNEAAPVTP